MCILVTERFITEMKNYILYILLTILIAAAFVAEVSLLRHTTNTAHHQQELMDNRPTY